MALARVAGLAVARALRSTKYAPYPTSATSAAAASFQAQDLESRDLQAKVRLSSLQQIPGETIEEDLGVVVGASSRTRSVLHDIAERLRSIIGGKLPCYEELVMDAMAEATRGAMDQATQLEGNAIVQLRYSTSTTDSRLFGISYYVVCYGTAVRLRAPATDSSESAPQPPHHDPSAAP
eukprot:m.252238 g.252238  ORF g.252238 m.252238 type:complete len:179 (-) comp17670_c0_seq1:149-685(-)